jgi:hypothetical protein
LGQIFFTLDSFQRHAALKFGWTLKLCTLDSEDSPDQYMDTIQQLMVAMTFSDGNASITPKCWQKDISDVWIWMDLGGS